MLIFSVDTYFFLIESNNQEENMQAFRRHAISLILGSCCVVATASLAFGQVDQGTITGVVQDTSGAVVPNADVILTNTDTSLTLKARTNGSGIYVFPPLKIGNYEVTAQAAGFDKTVQKNVHLDVQERLNVNLTLHPGTVSQTLTVTTAPSLLQTQSGSVGQVLSTESIDHTPLSGRNWVYAIQLTAGVVPSTSTKGGGTGDFSANGQRGDQNNFLLDGVDNNVNIMDLMNGASYNVLPPPDALSEFKVDTADYSAEFGHSAGAAVNATIKSGTNQIHGDAWEYFRNTNLSAQNWNALTMPPYHNNQFGATLGLPILRNKLFFFGDVQANRVTNGFTDILSVPTALMRQGNFTELSNTSLTGSAKPTQLYQPNSGGTAKLTCNGQNNTFCPDQINSVAQGILNLYPMPNANSGKTYNNYVENLTAVANTFQWDTRFDWNISPRDQAFTRLSYMNTPGYTPPPLGPILNGSAYSAGQLKNLIENVVASETHIFSPNLFNEVRFGYNYGGFAFLQPYYNTNLAAQLGFGGIPYGPGWPYNGGLPEVTVGGITGFGASGYDPSIEHQNIYQILDNVTRVVGNHSLKFGVDFQNIRVAAIQPPQSRGAYDFSGLYTSNLGASYTGSGIADFLADQMASAKLTNEVNINDAMWYRAAYAQDDWRITQKLTLNLGLRYDYFQPFRETSGAQANFNVTSLQGGVDEGAGIYLIPAQSQNVALPAAFQNILAQNNITLKYVKNPALVNGQYTDFAPRVGFAFSPSNNTVVHGGFGIFYGGLEPVGVGPNMGLNFPFGASDSFSRPNCAPNSCPSIPENLETGFSVPLAAGLQNYVSLPSLQGIPENSKTTNTMSYNLSMQQSLSNNMVASIGYVGNVTRHLVSNDGFNAALALQNPANNSLYAEPFQGIGGGTIMAYIGESSYNSLQTKLQKRFSNGMNFLATYTWAHALDDSYDPIGGGVSDRNFNLIPIREEYTNSPYDIRHRFNFNGYYELPFGKGRTHLNHSGLINAVAGGWATNIVFFAQTGKPFTVSDNVSTASGGSARAILVGDPFAPGGSPDPSNPTIACAPRTHTKTNWYNPCAFANPLAGTLIPRTGAGSLVTDLTQVYSYLGGRSNLLHGPGIERVNASLFKDFNTWREQSLELRIDAFNVLNTPSYSIGESGINSNGGEITGTQSFQNNTPDARFFQLSAKYKF
jgi:hypothetical protein